MKNLIRNRWVLLTVLILNLLSFCGFTGERKEDTNVEAVSSEELEVQVFPGLDSVYREATAMPVTVTIQAENGFEGTLRLVIPGNEEISSVAYEQEFKAAVGEPAIIHALLYPNVLMGEIRVDLENTAHTVVYQDHVTVEAADMTQMLCGVLTDDPDRFLFLQDEEMRGSGYYAIAKLRPLFLESIVFPTQEKGLDALSLLLLDVDASRLLDEEQQQTLKDWEDHGGIVVRTTGKTEQEIRDLLKEVETAKGSELYQTMSTTYPFDDYYSYAMELEAMQTEQPPNLLPMILAFAVFLLLLCPGLYLLLKKLDRREWFLLAVPAASLIVTLFLFLFYRDLRITRARASSLTRIVYDAETDACLKTTASMIISPDAGSVDIRTAGDPSLVMACREEDTSFYTEDTQLVNDYSYRISLKREPDGTVIGTNALHPFSRNFVETWDPETNDIGLETELSRTIGGLKGKVANHTGYDLSGVIIFSAERSVIIGNIKQGEVISFDRSVSTEKVSWDFGAVTIPGLKDGSQERERVSSMFYQMMGDRMYAMSEEEACVFAFIEDYEPVLAESVETRKSSACILIHRPLSFDEHPEIKSYDLLDLRDPSEQLLDFDGQMLGTEAELTLTIPYNRAAAFVRTEGTNETSCTTKVFLYNYESGQYDEVLAEADCTLENTTPYLDKNGTFRIRLQAANDYDYAPQIRVLADTRYPAESGEEDIADAGN